MENSKIVEIIIFIGWWQKCSVNKNSIQLGIKNILGIKISRFVAYFQRLVAYFHIQIIHILPLHLAKFMEIIFVKMLAITHDILDQKVIKSVENSPKRCKKR